MSDHATFEQNFGAALAGTDRVDDPALARALAVHRNTATKAAMDALAANYPVTRRLCGEEPFAACASAYLDAHPPTDPRLCFYGEHLAAFVIGYRPFGNIPWLTDVAALEWLCIEALFAADAPMRDGAAIAHGLDTTCSLRLHPAVRFASFDAPAAAIWLAHQADATEGALEIVEWERRTALVTRPDTRLTVTELDVGATAFLTACAAGAPLGDAALAASAEGSDVPTLFSDLITAGAFA